MKKILIATLVIIVVLLISAVSLPFLFKDKIHARIKEEINRQLNAKVDYSDVSLSLIRSFPNFHLTLHDLCIAGVKDFKDDTLLQVKKLSFVIDLMSVIKGGAYKVLAIHLQRPTVHAIVNYAGKANWDITKPTPSTGASSPFALHLKKVTIENGNITYDDNPGHLHVKASGMRFEGSGNITQDVYDLATQTNIDALSIKSGGISYLSKGRVNARVNLHVDNPNHKYTLRDNLITVNALQLALDGFVQTRNNDIITDLTFRSPQTEFRHILSLIPAIYTHDFDKMISSGSIALNGSVKGTYSGENYPAFQLQLKIQNGQFKYPSLPVTVSGVNVAASVNKPQGSLDASVIDIQQLHANIGQDPIDARILIKTPVSNPNVAADVKAKVNLSNIPKLVPLDDVRALSGLLQLDLDFKGNQRDLDNKNYEAITAAGNAQVTNLVYDSKDIPIPVNVRNMTMNFSPRNISLTDFQAQIGKSDIKAKGTLDNFMSYIFGKGDLLGTLEMQSNVFDANEWLQKENPAPTDTTKTEYFKVPANINFTASASFGKIFYEKLVLSNVRGDLTIRDEALHLSNLHADVLGGHAQLDVTYNTKNKDYPDVTFNYDIDNFDFQQTYHFVGIAPKMAPVIRYLQGNFSSDMKGSGKLNRDMSVDFSSLTGDGKVEIPYARITGIPVLSEVAKVAKIQGLQNLELKNGWTLLRFKNGKVNVEPTDLRFGNGYNLHLQGANGFDQTIDYDFRLDIPSKELGPAAAVAQNMLAKIPGSSASLPEVVGFVFKATGKADKPQIKLVKVMAGSNSVQEVVKDALEDAKAKAEEEARRQAEEMKRKAEEELQKQKQAAEDAARKAKEEAERKAREAAEKAKKEAEQKLKDMFKFPKK
ncbi:MAG: AsmA family protein [Chitinophagales bacterium]|nr:AsmA family protein [Chitinophagales bacterium]MDW8418789.1 AsmA-like C-terminal region-containing protein [Chitinophagales bacterium]